MALKFRVFVLLPEVAPQVDPVTERFLQYSVNKGPVTETSYDPTTPEASIDGLNDGDVLDVAIIDADRRGNRSVPRSRNDITIVDDIPPAQPGEFDVRTEQYDDGVTEDTPPPEEPPGA